MSFVPIIIPVRSIRQAEVSVAITERAGIRYVDFRFSREGYKTAGWSRYERISPFIDRSERLLLFATAEHTDPAARALSYQGGNQLSVRFARVGVFAEITPETLTRTALPIVRSGDGQLVVSLAPITTPTTPPPLTA